MAGLLLLACFREPSRLSDKQVNPRQTKRAGANCRVSRSKIQRVSDPYFDPLAGLQPFTLYYDFRQKRPKAYYKFTAIYTIFIHSYNSNPSFSAKQSAFYSDVECGFRFYFLKYATYLAVSFLTTPFYTP